MHFQLQLSKRFILTKEGDTALIRGELHYRSDVGVAKGVCKKGKRIKLINPDAVQPRLRSKADKNVSINNLLRKHFGPDWKSLNELKFYKNVMDNIPTNEETSIPPVYDEESCIPVPQDESLVI